MDKARAAFGPVSPAGAGGRPNAFGIDDDLEGALLAGLTDTPEESDGPTLGARSDPAGPPGRAVGARTSAPDIGRSAAASAPPIDRSDPDGENEPRVGLPGVDRTEPASEPPRNRASVPSPGLEEAPGGALPARPSSLPEYRIKSAEPAGLGEDADPLAGAPETSTDGAESSAGLNSRTDPEAWSDDGHGAGIADTGSDSTDGPDAGPRPDPPGLVELLHGLSDAPSAGEGDPGTPSASSPEPESGSETTSRAGNGADAEPVHHDSSLANWASPAFSPDPALEQALREGLSASPPITASQDDPGAREPASGSSPEPESGSETASRAGNGAGAEPAHHDSALANWASPAFSPDPALEQALREGLSASPPIAASQDDPVAREPESGSSPGAAPEPAPDLESRAAPPSHGFDPALEPASLPEDGATSGTVGEPTVLAFATDPESESALREGLAEHPNPQVWPGGLRNAILTLEAGQSSPLLFVDLDETAYPAGAIHDLAAVCEVGTVVIAFGSDVTARFSREVLLAGVSDYLVKPIAAATVREAAARSTASARPDTAEDPAGGWSVGFAGTGGSGATTLAAATALLAAERGRYVSVLDLNRTFPALSFLLDVEPAPGLVELLSTGARASLHPEVVDEMRAERSDRVAVYGYPWSAVPPPGPPVWAICELLVELQRRSHLVLVDGLDDPATRVSLLAMVDARVFVAEPTVTGAASAGCMLSRFGPMFDSDWPLLLVQNHTRQLKPRTGARILRDAGVEATPDVVVPFEPTLPAHSDRGWPEDRLPRSLRKSLTALVDRILAMPAAVPALA